MGIHVRTAGFFCSVSVRADARRFPLLEHQRLAKSHCSTMDLPIRTTVKITVPLARLMALKAHQQKVSTVDPFMNLVFIPPTVSVASNFDALKYNGKLFI
eukprot:1871664-Amphidinium_carterae.1